MDADPGPDRIERGAAAGHRLGCGVAAEGPHHRGGRSRRPGAAGHGRDLRAGHRRHRGRAVRGDRGVDRPRRGPAGGGCGRRPRPRPGRRARPGRGPGGRGPAPPGLRRPVRVPGDPAAEAVVADRWRPVWAEIDLDAVRHNASVLCRLAHPAALCAVVKADGYGHGAVPVARAALEGGATWLAVALVEEGVALRQAGIEAPILLLSEPPGEAAAEAVAQRLVPTVYSRTGLDSLSKVAGDRSPPLVVHLKVDTGMHRVGVDPDDASVMAGLIAAHPRLALGAVWTHLAVADGTDPDDRAFSAIQLERFDTVLAALGAAGHRPPMTHAANSAGAIAFPQARQDMVRCGITVYGVAPTPALADELTAATGSELHPVLSLAVPGHLRPPSRCGRAAVLWPTPAPVTAEHRGHRAHRVCRRGAPSTLRPGGPGPARGGTMPAGRCGDHGPGDDRLRPGRWRPGGGG